MRDQQDDFWNAVLAADTPSAEEMAQAEAGLRELEPAASLPQERIDAMVAAVDPASREMAAPRRSGHRNLVRIAAALLLSLALAWGVLEVVWREGRNAILTLDYPRAIIVATEPHTSEEHKLAAIFIIDLQCGYAFPALRTLCAEDVPTGLRNQAREIQGRLVEILVRGANQAPKPVNVGIVQAVEAALNANLSIEQRQQALFQVGDFCTQGMRAFTLTELRTEEGNQKREIYRKRLLRELTG